MAYECAMDSSLTSASLYTAKLQGVIEEVDNAGIDRVAEEIYRAYVDGCTIYVIGNGGSATLATHMACDLGKNVSGGDKRIRALAFTDNTAMMTAWANDLGYDSIFAEQIKNFVEPGDVVFAISASGNSKNVINAIEVGRKAGARIVGITGFQGGKMKPLCDECLVVPSDNMQIIEDIHTVVTHAVATILYNKLLAESEARSKQPAFSVQPVSVVPQKFLAGERGFLDGDH